MPRLLVLLSLLAVSGCVSSGLTMAEDAVPLADEATRSIDGLVEYLDASGIDVIGVLTEPELGRTTERTELQFSQGGNCTVLTYKDPADAAQFDTGSAQYHFGPFLARCGNEDVLVFQALQTLEEYDESRP